MSSKCKATSPELILPNTCFIGLLHSRPLAPALITPGPATRQLGTTPTPRRLLSLFKLANSKPVCPASSSTFQRNHSRLPHCPPPSDRPWCPLCGPAHCVMPNDQTLPLYPAHKACSSFSFPITATGTTIHQNSFCPGVITDSPLTSFSLTSHISSAKK